MQLSKALYKDSGRAKRDYRSTCTLFYEGVES